MSDEYLDDWPDDGGDSDICPNCGGEGVVANCFEEFACLYPEEGCNFCMTRCDWCRPRKAPAP